MNRLANIIGPAPSELGPDFMRKLTDERNRISLGIIELRKLPAKKQATARKKPTPKELSMTKLKQQALALGFSSMEEFLTAAVKEKNNEM